MSSPAPAKVCTRCGQDCAGKPRVKDQHGRYTCQPCVEKIKAERGITSSPAPLTPSPPPPPASGPASEPEGFDVFALEPSADDPKLAPCRNCGAPVAESAVLCVSCGFNKKLGRTARESDVAAALPPPNPTAPQRARRTKCGQCGYDLRGITAPTCPECGASAMAPTRQEKDRENSKAVAKEAYLKPLVYFAVGYLGVCFIAGLQGGVGHVLFYSISLAIQIPIGVAVFWACCLVWIGFDAPIHLTAIRVAGIYALSDLAGSVFGFLPLVGWVASLLVYAGLMMELLEIDLQDAVLVSVATFVVKVILVIYFIAWIQSMI